MVIILGLNIAKLVGNNNDNEDLKLGPSHTQARIGLGLGWDWSETDLSNKQQEIASKAILDNIFLFGNVVFKKQHIINSFK